LELAIQHALCGQDWVRAAYLIDYLADGLLGRDQASDLYGWLQALPGDYIQAWPRLRLIQAQFYLRNAELERAGRLLDEIRSQVADPDRLASLHLPSGDPGAEGSPDLRGHLEELRAELALESGQVELAMELAQRALQELPLIRPLWRGLAAGCLAQALIHAGEIEQAGLFFAQAGWEAEQAGSQSLKMMNGLGRIECLWRLGRLQAALETCQELLRSMLEQGRAAGPLAGRLYARWAGLLVEGGQLDEALAAAGQARTLGGDSQPAGLDARLALAQVHLARREYQAARQILAGGEALPEEYSLEADLLRIEVELAAAEDQAARQLFKALNTDRLSRLDREEQRVERLAAGLLLAQGRAGEALARLKALDRDHFGSGHVPAELDSLILLARAHQAVGSEQAALDMLSQALFLAAPESWLQPFLKHGRAMTRLLYRAAAQDIQPDFINQLLAKCPPK
jgi:LuxR family transcriptional regulator, maltose regulon positive regulatory protein